MVRAEAARANCIHSRARYCCGGDIRGARRLASTVCEAREDRRPRHCASNHIRSVASGIVSSHGHMGDARNSRHAERLVARVERYPGDRSIRGDFSSTEPRFSRSIVAARGQHGAEG